MVASDAKPLGFESELQVSVPNPSAARLVATDVALPPLDPAVLSDGSYALPTVPPTELMPKSPNGNSSRLALPRITAPPAFMPAATCESTRGRWSTSASAPPVEGNSVASMLSLSTIGTPWNGPSGPPEARLTSRDRASAIARGLSARMALNVGP